MPIKYGNDYVDAITSNENFKSCFKIYSVSGTDLLNGINSPIDEDIVSALGSFSFNFNFAGELEIKGMDRGAFYVEDIRYRIWDSFDYIGSQSLGRWKRDPFSVENPSTLFWNRLIKNDDFRSLYEKITGLHADGGTPWDFVVVSKYYPVTVKINGFDFSIDFTGKINVSIF